MSKTFNDLFPTKYLKAGDMPEEGVLPLTIREITTEELGKDKDEKPVIYFDETKKGLVCNITNGKLIKRALGTDNPEEWIGQIICLYKTEVDSFGEMVEAIRVKLKSPKKQTSDDDEEQIPF